MNFLRYFVFMMVVSLAWQMSYPAHAQNPENIESLKKPMPQFELQAPEVFAASTDLQSDVPFNDQDLAYEVRLPKNWKESETKGFGAFSLTNIVLGELAQFFGPPNPDLRSFFKIDAIELKYQLTAEQWMVQYMLEQGLTIEGFQVIHPNRVEVLYVHVEDGETYVVRSVGIISGKRVILASYFMPSTSWDEEKKQQAQMIKNFKLLNVKNELIEAMKDYAFLDIAKFQYPESWELRTSPIRSIDRMSAKLFNVAIDDRMRTRRDSRTINGKIEINLVSIYAVKSLDDEIERLKKELSATGLVIEDLIETTSVTDIHDRFEFGQINTYNAADPNDALLNYEFWITTMSTGEYYYFVTLLTPRRSEDFDLWSRNSEAFKVLLSLIEPLNES